MLMMDVQEVAKELQVSPRHVWALCSSARLPEPVRVGRCVRWPRETIEEWIRAGCPDLESWRAMKEGG